MKNSEILDANFRYYIPFFGRSLIKSWRLEKHFLLFEGKLVRKLEQKGMHKISYLHPSAVPLCVTQTPAVEILDHMSSYGFWLIGPYPFFELRDCLELYGKLRQECEHGFFEEESADLVVRILQKFKLGEYDSHIDVLADKGWREILQSRETPKLSIPD